LNEGISLAKGKYIARMDADDISLPERLEQQFEYLENNPEITILGTYIEAFGNELVEKFLRIILKLVNGKTK